MAQPLAVYASANPLLFGGDWVTFLPTPVPPSNVFPFWPNLALGGDNIVPTGPFENPDYLFAASYDPTIDQTFIFTRQWSVTTGGFSANSIPGTVSPVGTSYSLVLSHAADNVYAVGIIKVTPSGSAQLQPPIFNFNVPDSNPWRNAKTIEYAVTLAAGETLQVQTAVTNFGIPGSTPQTNPGMFTWTLQLY